MQVSLTDSSREADAFVGWVSTGNAQKPENTNDKNDVECTRYWTEVQGHHAGGKCQGVGIVTCRENEGQDVKGNPVHDGERLQGVLL